MFTNFPAGVVFLGRSTFASRCRLWNDSRRFAYTDHDARGVDSSVRAYRRRRDLDNELWPYSKYTCLSCSRLIFFHTFQIPPQYRCSHGWRTVLSVTVPLPRNEDMTRMPLSVTSKSRPNMTCSLSGMVLEGSGCVSGARFRVMYLGIPLHDDPPDCRWRARFHSSRAISSWHYFRWMDNMNLYRVF